MDNEDNTYVIEPEKATENTAPKETYETKGLTIIDKVTANRLAVNDEKLKKRDGSHVFPIRPKLKLELQLLKGTHLGDIKTQFKFVREQKYEQYTLMNKKRMEKIKKEVSKASERLCNKARNIMKTKRNEDRRQRTRMVSQAKDFYKATNELHKKYPTLIKEYSSYDFPLAKFKKEEDQRETKQWELLKQDDEDINSFKLSVDENTFQNVLKKEFEQKYAKAFEMVDEKIKALERQFDEALLFGDLQVVKEIYYDLKKAEGFVEGLRTMKLK